MINMKYKLDLPEEPEGPVWDQDGDRYDRRGDRLWYPEYDPEVGIPWRCLVAITSELTDVNSDYPNIGELSRVTTIDRHQYVISPHTADRNRLIVVLPPEDAGDEISADIVQFCTPLVAVPQSYADLSGNAKEWLYENQELQPNAAKELLADYDPEDDDE